MPEDEKLWHREVISQAVEHALQDLSGEPLLGRFYLAGGTGLALHLGHRRSLDLDLFTAEPFDPDKVVSTLQKLPDFSLAAKSSDTLHVVVRGIKVSFLGFLYPLLFPSATFGGVQIADPRDIACMKINAIAGRGTRRDFLDLYVASRRFGLRELLGMFKQKYAQANYSVVHVLKSLTFFEDAEKDPMPDMLVEIHWGEVKQFFASEIPGLL